MSADRFFELSAALLAEGGPDGRLVRVNPAWERTLGWTEAALLAEPWPAFVHPDDHAATEAAYAKLRAGEEGVAFENRWRHRDGGWRWLSWNAVADRVTGRTHGVAQDVTVQRRERKARERAGLVLEASQERYRQLLDTIDQGFCVVQVEFDAADRAVDYRFIEVNPAFSAMTGLVDARGRSAREMIPDLEPFWFETYGKVARTGEPAHFEAGSEAMGRVFDVHASRVGAPHEHNVALLFTDVTDRRRAERDLRDREARFRELADAAPAMIWVTEPDGRCSFLSRGWFDYTGQDERHALDFGWLEGVHPDDRPRAEAEFLAANTRREAFALTHRLRRRDGVYRWVIDSGRPRSEADGRFAGYVGSVIDVHDRQRMQERLDLVVNTTRVGFWHCDLPFDRLMWNVRVKEHFGLPPETEVSIDTFYERLHPDDRERTRAAIARSIEEHTDYDIEYRTVGLDGIERWVRAIGRAQYDGDRPVAFDGITIDVSEHVRRAEALAESDRRKDRFLAMLAHELRNPLAPLRNGLAILRLAGDPAVREQTRVMMERQLGQLVRLVDDLLDLSRINQDKIVLRRELVPVGAVVQQAVETARPAIEQRGHRLEVPPFPGDLVLDVDPTRLAQVLSNLLNNAVKFTPEGGHITLAVTREAASARIEVRDDGVGIDPAMLPKIFEMFTQADASLERSQGGLGIGLSLARGLVEMHGGSLAASSEGAGRGSVFTVHLPLPPRAFAEVESRPALAS